MDALSDPGPARYKSSVLPLNLGCSHDCIFFTFCFVLRQDKGVGLVMKFWVRIPKRSVLVLGRASNLKLLLCCITKPCSVAGILGNSSVTQKRKNCLGSSPGKNAEVKKIDECFSVFKREMTLKLFNLAGFESSFKFCFCNHFCQVMSDSWGRMSEAVSQIQLST